MQESANFKKYRMELRDLPTLHVNDVRHVSSTEGKEEEYPLLNLPRVIALDIHHLPR